MLPTRAAAASNRAVSAFDSLAENRRSTSSYTASMLQPQMLSCAWFCRSSCQACWRSRRQRSWGVLSSSRIARSDAHATMGSAFLSSSIWQV